MGARGIAVSALTRHFIFITLTLLAISLGGITDSAWALPLERADPSALGPEGDILAVIPPMQFTVEESLKRNVDFWIHIYTQYGATQGLVHDAKYIDHIYEILDLKDTSEKSSSHLIKNAKRKWKEVLLSVQRKQGHPETFTVDEKKVFDLFKDVDEPNKFLNASHRKRLRFQLGQKDRFLDGLYQSGRFLPWMEEAFRKEGMPIELTRLPFVESSFNVKARSKVGASGIWQFMRSTGRVFIKVSDVIDERNDPIRATFAAAKLLRLNYESLGSWPLAVTAYNHGRQGMMRAVRRVGSDELEKVVAEYHQRSFGFASSNFFTELLAAIEVEKQAEKYFGKIERAKPVDFIEVRMPDFVDVGELLRRLKLNVSEFREINPAFTDAVYSGLFLIPKDYLIRVPYGPDQDKNAVLKSFWEIYALIPPVYKLRAQRAAKYGIKEKSVRHRNKNRSSFPQGGRKLCATF